MGEFASTVQARLRDRLAESLPTFSWQTEHRIAGTPVDVAGASDDHIIIVELEWRRADPADNTAKLFRHLSTDRIVRSRVTVAQVFTAYYDLKGDGVSSKRKNAEFVGRTASETIDRLSYHPVDFALTPPKRGGDWPDDWKQAADQTAERIDACIDG
ncbi:hypothetical protein G9464_04965 [Halostella sp. JP-L12]|uniref:hypothetical protein n=1 Tax=Halostella TaxID=1843185 RepID=UPI000EF75B05|nr:MULTISPECIES: hypothetical protein [Halostella]NHN46947.1 hypothetical protein [Halostella sp. JP-L12]